MNVWKQRALSILSLIFLAFVPMAMAHAQVKVTSAAPEVAPQGTISLDVTVAGSGFDNSAKAKFLVTGTADPGGIVVKKVVVTGPKSLIATIDIAADAQVDKFDVEVELSSGRKGKGTSLFSVSAKPSGEADNCVGAASSFVFNKSVPGTSRRDFYLADATAGCQKFLFSVSAGNYPRMASFRVVDGVGRVVTTDGIETLLLATFAIGEDMNVGPVSVRQVFGAANPGWIDNGWFDLSADGKSLAYITTNEDGGSSWLTRLRLLANIDDCVDCSYEDGDLLAEHVGLNHVLGAPRFSIDGSKLWLEDRRGDFYRPYLSTVPVTSPTSGLHLPEIVVDGGSLSSEVLMIGLRASGSTEILAYSSRTTPYGCHELVAVDTEDCSNGACARVNSTTPRVLMSRPLGSIQAASSSSLEFLLEDAKEGKKGKTVTCTSTGKIKRVVDTGSSVQSSEIADGDGPASR